MISFEKLFGKNIDDISLEDVEKYFISPREESDLIEYKSYTIHPKSNPKHEKREYAILKTICAMLNSNGGLIIWGAPRENSNEEGDKLYSGGLELISSENKIVKDDFISKVLHKITPPPSTLKCSVLYDDEQNSLLLIEVRESTYRPHQFDNQYFMRADGQTRHAPHHYIEALFKSVKYPRLFGVVRLEKTAKKEDKYQLHFRIVIANISELINEETVFFKFTTSHGVMAKDHDRVLIGNGKHILGTNYVMNANIRDVLHYGEAIKIMERIEVNANDLIKNNNIIEVFITFGGKKSPLLISSYLFKVKEIAGKLTHTVVLEEKNNLYADKAIEYYGTSEGYVDEWLE